MGEQKDQLVRMPACDWSRAAHRTILARSSSLITSIDASASLGGNKTLMSGQSEASSNNVNNLHPAWLQQCFEICCENSVTFAHLKLSLHI